MLPQNQDQVLLGNTFPPGCPPCSLSQPSDSPHSNLQRWSLRRSPPDPHPSVSTSPETRLSSPFPPQTHTSSPQLHSCSHLDLPPHPYSSSLPSLPTFSHQSYPYLSNPQSSSNCYWLCTSPPFTHPSSASQQWNSLPESHCQSTSHPEDLLSSPLTSRSPALPSPGIYSNRQAQHWSRGTRSPGVVMGCTAGDRNPAEFRNPGSLAQTLVARLGLRRIAHDLRLLLLQHLWFGRNSQAPVVEYPICLLCLHLRSPSCPISKYSTGPQLLAFPQLLPCARGKEFGPRRMGIGFGLRLSLGEARALNLLPKRRQKGARPRGKAAQSPWCETPAAQAQGAWGQADPAPGTSSYTQSLRSAHLQTPDSTQRSGLSHQASNQASPKPSPSPDCGPQSFPQKFSSQFQSYGGSLELLAQTPDSTPSSDSQGAPEII
ncbi:proline-rich protein 30 [Cavia porcellus]|uniref:proline-rich protein 30 n=1 Tax=Cavia porcellus TaxID=10141 RepID=UPI000661DDE9|nr:proline-rich protein 30 [Cavia porcellus]